MKAATIGFLIVGLIFGTLAIRQWQRANSLRAEAATLQLRVDELEARLENRGKELETMRVQLREALSAAAVPAPAVSREGDKDAETKPAGAKPKAAGGFADMFKSPEMREMIHNQQKAAMAGNVDRNYAKFLSDFQMTPEQVTAFKELVTRKMLIDAEMGMSLMAGDADAAKRKEMVDKAKADKDAINEEIKQFLGEDNYKELQAYEKSQPERSTISRFRERIAGGTTPLSGEQEQQLIQTIGEARRGFKFTTDYNDSSKVTLDPATYFTDEKLEQHTREQEQLHQSYLEKVQDILSAEQLAAFGKYLANQREVQAASMKVGKAMLEEPKKEEK